MQEQLLPQSASPRTDTAALRKARGAFFTPSAIAAHMTEWAIRTAADRVLEPSCGDAEFLVNAVARLRFLGAATPRVSGVEIHADSAATARDRVAGSGGDAEIVVSDFFAVEPDRDYDVVIGNPPYIGYSAFAGDSRAVANAAATQAGVTLSGLASSWAAFTVHATQFLKAGGRLAFVLPAELLTVGYAAPVRRFLLDNFSSVKLVTFEQQVFADVNVDVVLVLADGWQAVPTHALSVQHATNAAALAADLPSQSWAAAEGGQKWTPALLDAETLTAYARATAQPEFTVLDTWGETRLGTVTGNNNYFALTGAQVSELGLHDDVVPLSPPKSAHLRGLELSGHGMAALTRDGARTFLFRPGPAPSTAALAYVAAGEVDGVHLAYKCRMRSTWWRVPRHEPADLFITSMNATTPRISANSAQVHHLNSVHGIYLHDDVRRLGSELLALASLNSVTVLGAEIVGRAYGGGLLKLEPGEARVLPVPGPELVRRFAVELEAVRGYVASLLERGLLLDAVAAVDEILLVRGMGLSALDVAAVRMGRQRLADRRGARGRSANQG